MTTQATIPGFTSAPPPYRAPHDPARVPELIEALKKVGPLHDLEEAEYEWLATHGTEVFAETGAIVFREGDPASKMTILLKGEVYVRREHGGPSFLFIGRSGLITGLLPFSRMKAYGGLGYTSAPTMRHPPMKYTPMRCTSVRYTPMRCTPMTYKPMRCTLCEVHAHETLV